MDLTPLLALMTVALVLFSGTGVALRSFAHEPGGWAAVLIGATGIIAMAIQNTLMRDALCHLCPTTVMTGNLTQFTIDLVELVLPMRGGHPDELARMRAEARRRLVKFGVPLGAFVLGALLSASLTSVVGLSSIALPTLGVGALTVTTWRASRSQRQRDIRAHGRRRRAGMAQSLPEQACQGLRKAS